MCIANIYIQHYTTRFFFEHLSSHCHVVKCRCSFLHGRIPDSVRIFTTRTKCWKMKRHFYWILLVWLVWHLFQEITLITKNRGILFSGPPDSHFATVPRQQLLTGFSEPDFQDPHGVKSMWNHFFFFGGREFSFALSRMPGCFEFFIIPFIIHPFLLWCRFSRSHIDKTRFFDVLLYVKTGEMIREIMGATDTCAFKMTEVLVAKVVT